MLSHSTRRIGVVLIAVLGAACGADRTIAPTFAPSQYALSLEGADSSGAHSDTTVASAVARRGASAVLVPSDTLRMITDTKLSRGRRTAFTSTNSTVASVNSSGLVQARGSGSALVIASDGSRADTLAVQVEPGPARIALAPSSVSVAVGSSYQLGATVVASTGVALTGRTLRFSSQNAAVASVSDVGLVTARTSGQAAVSVTDGQIVAAVQVAVQSTSTATSFRLNPGTSSITTGGSVQFTTATTWADGVARSANVTYSATGGAISMGGQFTAGDVAGTFMVIANCLCGWSDTSLVTIAPVVTLAAITISPESVTLPPGGSQVFSTTARWSNGSTAVPLVSYAASGGTITAAGVYTAPATVGTYRVIVSESAGPLRDTAVVTVATSGGAPVTPGPGAAFSARRLSASVASIGGGARLQLFGTGFGSDLRVQFDGIESVVQLTSDSTAFVTVPARSAAGTVGVTVKQGIASTALSIPFEYLPKPTKHHFSLDFENGSLTGTGAWAGAEASAAISSETAASGTKSLKLTVSGGFDANIARMEQGYLSANPPETDANGLYQKFSMYVPQSTFDNVWNTITCKLYVSNEYCGQVKLLLNRYNGTQREAAPGWSMTGIGPTMVDIEVWNPLASRHGQSAMDWGIVRLPGCPAYLLPANRWFDIQIWMQRRNGIGYMKVWLDGVLVGSCSDKMLGSSTSTDVLSMWLGIAYTQHIKGAISVFVDKVRAADGFIDN